MRRNDEEGIYVVKTVKVSSEAEMESIRDKRKDLREKRRRRRHA